MKKTHRAIYLINKTLITWFGCGLVPKAPGTAGTIGTIPLAWYLSLHTSIDFRIFMASLVTLIACLTAGFDQTFTKSRDPQYVVIDETAGFLWSCAWIPARADLFLAAFIFFRAFDVWKPFPANFFDRSSKTSTSPWARGAHIVFDDVFAGFYAAACCAALLKWVL